MKEKDIDRLFREAFHEAEQKPSQNVWQQIEKQLDEEKKIIHLPSKNRHWIAYVAAALLLALSVTFIQINYNTETRATDNETTIAINQRPANPAHTDFERSQIVVKTELDNKQMDNKKQNKIALIATAASSQTAHQTKTAQHTTTRMDVELKINKLEESRPDLTGINELSQITVPNIPVYQVTEIEDIKPLIEPEEEIESMYAQAAPNNRTDNKNIVTSILNTISENIEVSNTKDIRFRADEEGSLRIDILNSLVKNRNKKRK